MSHAAMYGKVAVVSVLLKHGADPNVEDSFGRTPLTHAIVSCSKDLVDLLLQHGANYDLRAAIMRGDLAQTLDILKENPRAVRELPHRRLVELVKVLGVFVSAECGGVGSKEDRVNVLRALFRHGAAFSATEKQEISKDAFEEIRQVIIGS